MRGGGPVIGLLSSARRLGAEYSLFSTFHASFGSRAESSTVEGGVLELPTPGVPEWQPTIAASARVTSVWDRVMIKRVLTTRVEGQEMWSKNVAKD